MKSLQNLIEQVLVNEAFASNVFKPFMKDKFTDHDNMSDCAWAVVRECDNHDAQISSSYGKILKPGDCFIWVDYDYYTGEQKYIEKILFGMLNVDDTYTWVHFTYSGNEFGCGKGTNPWRKGMIFMGHDDYFKVPAANIKKILKAHGAID